MLADRVRNIKPSATLALAAEATRLKNMGHDMVNLAIGEPEGNPPPWIIESVQQALEHDSSCHKYTHVNGLISLRQAIAEDIQNRYHVTYDPSNEIIVGVGAKQVIYHAFMATLNPGDEVIIPTPYWVSYPEMVELAGGKAVYVSAQLKPKQLEEAITPQTKWIILNSPANPTGFTLSHTTLQGMLPVLEKNPHVYILCDDIYQDLIYDNQSFESLLTLAPSTWRNRFLMINGVSKAFAMTGWRIGYGCGSKDIIQAINLIQSQSSSNATTIAQIAAEAALKGPKDFLNTWRAHYQKRRDMCQHTLRELGMDCPGGQGAFYIFASCASWLGRTTPQGQLLKTDVDVAEYLLYQHHVVVVPGTSFGGEGFIRISYATSDDILAKGLQRIQNALQACQ